MFNKKFKNLDGHVQSPFKAFKWLFSRRPVAWPKFVAREQYVKPIALFDEKDEVMVTFIGHSTVLLQCKGLNIITDPVFSSFIGPNRFVGIKRIRESGIEFTDLPKIDLILLSHDHYDHMDVDTLKLINQRDAPFIVTSFGNLKKLSKIGYKEGVELNWWHSFNFKGLFSITFVPSQHFSGRSLFGSNTTLWGGFVIELDSSFIYFAGDSGFSAHFELINERFPKIDLAFLPIGVYEPRWFLKYIHMNPIEAVKAHKILNAKQSIAIHYGTFHLSDEGINEPIIELRKAADSLGLMKDEFIALREGQRKSFKLQYP